MDAGDVVLGFLAPPGAGKDGVPLQTLFGFERVHVPAGQSVNVYLYPEHTDFMHTALDGTKTAAAGEWTRVHVGVLFESAVSDPHGRSQFSFDDGRSACSFLVCDAAALLWEALGAGGEIQGAEVTEGHVAAALTRGMQRYADGPRDSLAMMGLDHTSVLEVLEFCGWVWNGELTVVCVCERDLVGWARMERRACNRLDVGRSFFGV